MKLPLVLCVLLVLSTWANADIANVLTATDRSAAEVHARITAPTITQTTNQVTIVKDPEIVAWEQAVAEEIVVFVTAVTGNPTNALQRVGALTSVQMLAAVRQAKGRANNSQRQQLEDMSDALMLLYQDAQRRGYSWPLPPDFGQPTRTAHVVTSAPGPSLWATRFPGQPPPTVDQVRAQLTLRQSPAPPPP
jgi:hypothetical protein